MKEIKTEAGRRLLNRAVAWGEAADFVTSIIVQHENIKEGLDAASAYLEGLEELPDEILQERLREKRPGKLSDKELFFLIDYATSYYEILKEGKPEERTPLEITTLLYSFYEDPDGFEAAHKGDFKKGIYKAEGEEDIIYLIDARALEAWRSINNQLRELYDRYFSEVLDPIMWRENRATDNARSLYVKDEEGNEIQRYSIYKPNNNGIAWGYNENKEAEDISDLMGYLNNDASFIVISWIEDTLRNYSYIGRPAPKPEEARPEQAPAPAKEIRPYIYDAELQSNASLSLKHYEHALEAKPNPYAYITFIDAKGFPFFLKRSENNDNAGDLIKGALSEEAKDGFRIKALNEADTANLRNIFGIVWERYKAGEDIEKEITISLTELVKTFNIRFERDIKTGEEIASDSKRRSFDDITANLSSIWGVLEEEHYFRAFVITAADSTTVSFISPYSVKLIDLLVNNPVKKAYNLKSGFTRPAILGVNLLVKSTITSSRASDATKELVKAITTIVLQRGQPKKGASCTIEKTLGELIKATPLLEYQLEKAESKHRGQVLTRTIYGKNWKGFAVKDQKTGEIIQEEPLLVKQLREYTRLYEKYPGFEIRLPERLSYRNLDEIIVIYYTNPT